MPLKNTLADIFIHSNSGSGADVDGAGGAEGLDKANVGGFFQKFWADAAVFGAENQSGVLDKTFIVERLGAAEVVLDCD